MRSTTAALTSLALLLAACTPYPTQESPRRPSEPPEVAGEDRTETRPEAEPADAESSEDKAPVAPETVDEPVPAPTPRTQDGDELATSEENRSEQAAQPATGTEAKPEPSPASEARKDIVLAGRITLTGGDAAPEEAVVYFVPESADMKSPMLDDSKPEEIVTRDKSLSPTVLAVSRGSEIVFPNEDPILHNLFSVSAGNDFDLGVYGPGEAPSVKFGQAGVVNIYCNVHHDMHAHVLVVDTPFRTRPDSKGNFRLTGLPAGPGELHIWHRQSKRWSRPLELPATAAFEVTLEITKPRLPPHRDKTGQSYNRRDRDPYR